MKVVQNVIRMSICDCQYVNMLECNYSAKVSIWKLFRMSSWCQNILARKVVQNVFMMSEHFIQKISTYTVFLVLTTSWLSTDWLPNLWTCSVLLVLLLNCYLHPTLDSCILKRKNLIHAETGIIDTDILLLVPHFYKQTRAGSLAALHPDVILGGVD